MKKKHDPPPVRDRLPAMFVGDEEPPPQPRISAEALVAGAPAAAMLPEDLRVTMAGTSASRVPMVVLGLLAVVFGGLAVVKVLDPSVLSYVMAALYAWIGSMLARWAWMELRHLIRSRDEYRLQEDGIVLNVLNDTDLKPRGVRIRWKDIADYTVSLDGETLHLRVEGARGETLSLKDSPPRLSTRELVRRFIVEAERHPRAPRHKRTLKDIIEAVAFPVFFVGGPIAEATLELSETQESIGFHVVVVIAFGFYLWHTLDDDDVARSDRTSKRLMARLRRWLRRVLDIRAG